MSYNELMAILGINKMLKIFLHSYKIEICYYRIHRKTQSKTKISN